MKYGYIPPGYQALLRDGENHVLFLPLLVDAIRCINGIGEAYAQATSVQNAA